MEVKGDLFFTLFEESLLYSITMFDEKSPQESLFVVSLKRSANTVQ